MMKVGAEAKSKREKQNVYRLLVSSSILPVFRSELLRISPPRHGQIYVFIHGAFLIVTHSSSKHPRMNGTDIGRRSSLQ